MPAGLDMTDGVASAAFAYEDAWHRLGETVDHAMTAEEVMEKAHLGGWNVRKIPAFGRDPETGLEIPMPDRATVIRDNPIRRGQLDYLGDVGKDYTLIQNEQHAEFLNILIDESGAHFTTAGALDGGRRVFVTMELPGHVLVGGADAIKNYIAAINAHDGSKSFTIMVTPVRIVCKNTENMAYRNHSNIFRIPHTTGAEKALRAKAREALDMTFTYLDSMNDVFEMLVQTPMTQSRFEELVTKKLGPKEDAAGTTVTRTNNKLESMFELFSDAQTQKEVRNTAWAGLNALTEWYDHHSPTRGDDADKDANRAKKALLEPKFKNDALDLMLAEAERIAKAVA